MVLGAAGAQGQTEQPLADGEGGAPAVCLTDAERETSLRVGLVTLTPAPLCQPTFQVIEIRNDGPTPLGEARLLVTAPLSEGRMAFAPLPGSAPGAPRFVEVSVNDGVTWSRVDPPGGVGTSESPLIFTSAQIPALRRLGAAGEPNDSVLVRWRASLGEAFGPGFAADALLGLSGQAVDACDRPARAPQRLSRLSLRRPALVGGLEGRNATRGGAFSTTVRAAPGDEIEWRAALENVGDATAQIARAQISRASAYGGDGGGVGPLATAALDGVAQGARRVAILRITADDTAPVQTFQLSPSWGCAAPDEGEAAAITPLGRGFATARLLTQPDPNAIALDLKMVDADGAPRPGDEAQVTVDIQNEGPPAFAAEVALSLPDGYGVDRSAPIAVFSTDGAVAGALWDNATGAGDDGPVEEARIRLVAADGAPAVLNPDALIQLRFSARRARRSPLASDRLSARVFFADAAGAAARSRPASITVSPRQSELSVRLRPLQAALVSGPGDAVRFRAEIDNTGAVAAERLTARVRLGAGWAPRSPDPTLCALDGPLSARTFLCTLPDAARPGGVVRFDFSAVAGRNASPPGVSLADAALARGDARADARADTREGAREAGRGATAEADPKAAGPINFSVSVDVAAHATAAARAERPIAAARAESGAVGFQLRQRMFDQAGRLWPERRPIDLGERVVVEVAALWWGAGAAAIEAPALFQKLPDTLAILRAEGQQDGATAPPAVLRRERNQVLWSLADLAGAGAFTARVSALAVAPDSAASLAPTDEGAGRQARGAPSRPEKAREQAAAEVAGAHSAEANAVFSLRGETYGVDALDIAATRAEPLVRRFRKPDLRVSLVWEPRDDGGPSSDRAVEGPAAGERRAARIRVRNAGAGPGFIDNLVLQAPAGVLIEPFAADGLDNDGDGRVDEADEAEFVERSQSHGARTSVRWIRLPAGAARRVGAEPSRLGAGAAVEWPIVLSVSADATPGSALPIDLRLRYGARPFGRRGQEAGRAALEARIALRPPPVDGALVLTGLSSGRTGGGGATNAVERGSRAEGAVATEPIRTARHGDRVSHRAILRLPPGRHRDARFGVRLSPAFTGATVRLTRLGRAARCPDAAEPELTASGALWALGDCAVDAAATVEERTLLLDVSARLRDADPSAPKAQRDAWRAAEAAAWFDRASRSAPGDSAPDDGGGVDPERFAAPLGRSRLDLTGPLLRGRLTSFAGPHGSDNAGEHAGLDAGDRFAAVFEITNLGDEIARRPAAQMLTVDGRAPRPTLDCAAIQLRAVGVAADQRDNAAATPPDGSALKCGRTVGLAPLRPGETARLDLSGRLSDAAPLGARSAYALLLADRVGDARNGRPGLTQLPLPARRPAPTLIDVIGAAAPPPAARETPARRLSDDQITPPAIGLGEVFALRARLAVPEGSGQAWAELRLRLVDAMGRPKTPAADLGGSLSPETADTDAIRSKQNQDSFFRVLAAELTRRAGPARFAENPGGINQRVEGDAATLSSVDLSSARGREGADADQGGWRRFRIPLGAVSLADGGRARDGPRDTQLDFDLTLALRPDPALRGGLRLEAEAELGLETDPAAPIARELDGSEGPKADGIAVGQTAKHASTADGAPPRIIAVVAEPAIALRVRRVDLHEPRSADRPATLPATRGLIQEGGGPGDGLARGDRALFVADACNVGRAPAYGVGIDGALPGKFALSTSNPPRFLLRDQHDTRRELNVRPSFGSGSEPNSPSPGQSLAAAPAGALVTGDAASTGLAGFGPVAVASKGPTTHVSAKASPGAAIAPGRCASLTVPVALREARDVLQATAEFRVTGYRSRPIDGAGRTYQGGPAALAVAPVAALRVTGPGEVELAPGATVIAPFVIERAGGAGDLRLSLRMEGWDGPWTLWRDANGDGALDADDPPWRDGAQLPSRGSLAVFATAPAPDLSEGPWRRVTTLRATGVGGGGEVASGSAALALRAPEIRLGALAAERRMAVDRDCDGDLRDESLQDAAFEAGKDIAPGECVVMRLTFHNPGAAAMESVTIEDLQPGGLQYAVGGARVVQAPEGLVLSALREPGASADREAAIRFEFVGALAPGSGGSVEYRLRLPVMAEFRAGGTAAGPLP